MALKLTNPQYYSDIADAIRAKNGTQDEYTPAEMAQAITDIPSGGGVSTAPENDVNFYDYDGSILYSYTAEDFLELTELPALPEREGFTAQDWNWTLENAQDYVQQFGILDIGVEYITDDERTRIVLEVEEEFLHISLTFRTKEEVHGTIFWGDGEITDFNYSTSNAWQQKINGHTYAAPGRYVVEIEVAQDSLGGILFGKDTNPTSGSNTDHCDILTNDRPYLGGRLYGAIKEVYVGGKAQLGSSALRYLTDLQKVTIPEDGLYIHVDQIMGDCYSIKHVTLPRCTDSVVAKDGFLNAGNLGSICFPEYGVSVSFLSTSGGGLNKTALRRLTLPWDVGDISSAAGGSGTLREVVLPSVTKVTSLGNNKGLKRAIYPSAVTLTASGFMNTAITEAIIPDTVNTIPSSCFNTCYQLCKVVIGAGVTSIAASAFASCYGCKEIHFKPTTPPSVVNSNAFNNLPSGCVIYVPEGTLSAYTSATNFPNPSTYTYVEEAE